MIESSCGDTTNKNLCDSYMQAKNYLGHFTHACAESDCETINNANNYNPSGKKKRNE